jgi:hypothetical protein
MMAKFCLACFSRNFWRLKKEKKHCWQFEKVELATKTEKAMECFTYELQYE